MRCCWGTDYTLRTKALETDSGGQSGDLERSKKMFKMIPPDTAFNDEELGRSKREFS